VALRTTSSSTWPSPSLRRLAPGYFTHAASRSFTVSPCLTSLPPPRANVTILIHPLGLASPSNCEVFNLIEPSNAHARPCTFSPTCELAVPEELVFVCFPQEDEPDPRRMQVNLTGFLERNAGANCVLQAREALFMLMSVLMRRELQGPSWASCGICASRPKRTSK
jgi:hypothetical protein